MDTVDFFFGHTFDKTHGDITVGKLSIMYYTFEHDDFTVHVYIIISW